ncbi:thioredoxin-dependent thiol peroxidase [Humisphaera borealis]|uniref:thioredoxin-dependent peroxiredoxin n=1 Tax=Humisphaera borealis TaxID=2807512 RepID=A0A7M2WSV3_9BACT|nr:thioredoxin-dependent thiol peroxidase [Humisphaera borealis]
MLKVRLLRRSAGATVPIIPQTNLIQGAQIVAETTAYPAVGKKAPAFSLPASSGETISLKDQIGKPVVVYFYPKADTPGCTKEACGFRDAIAGYKKAGVPVFGVSPDPVKAVTKFADKFDLTFPLLADEDHAVCDKYGVWQEKSMYGRKYMGAARVTFIIDKDGKVAHVFEKVKPEGHDAEVMGWLKEHGMA